MSKANNLGIAQLNEIFESGKISINGYTDSLEKIGDRYPDLKSKINAVAKAQEDYKNAFNSSDLAAEAKALQRLTKAQQELERSIVVKE